MKVLSGSLNKFKMRYNIHLKTRIKIGYFSVGRLKVFKREGISRVENRVVYIEKTHQTAKQLLKRTV